MVSSGLTRSFLVACHFLTWASSGIVVGITAYFLHNFPHDLHLTFEIVIAASTLAFWLPSFILPIIMPHKSFYLPLNLIFSYLWLTSFIFAAQDYNESECAANAPTGGSCRLKLCSEAFMFVAFFFTLAATVVDVLAWKGKIATRGKAGYGSEAEDARIESI